MQYEIEKGQQRYNSRMRGGGTRIGGMMKIGTFVELPDVSSRANFHLHRMGILQASGLAGGSKKRFSL
jgi:hypothetical protein